MAFSKKCVILMFASIYIFSAVMIAVYCKTGGVPPDLIVAFFAWNGVEGGAMAWIKNVKVKVKNDGTKNNPAE